MISDMNTYLNKAVPDTRLTIKKYLDAKFEYLVGGRWLYSVAWNLFYYSSMADFWSMHRILNIAL